MTVEIRDGSVEILGGPAGLRDLARWCLALRFLNGLYGYLR